MLEPLYKRTATGAIQVWQVEVDQIKGRYRTISGQLGGQQVTSEWTQCKAKNVGRANGVSVFEQAIREAQAAWDKKLRDGYSATAEEAHTSDKFQCMLAKEYVDPLRHKEALRAAEDGELYSQPKLDGVRLIASRASLLSRKHRPIVSVPHVKVALERVFQAHPSLVLDGELYNHDLHDDFDRIISLVRKSKPTPEDLEETAHMVQYWIYDCAGDGIGQLPYNQRFDFLTELADLIDGDCIRFVVASRVLTEPSIDRWYDQYLEQGYEGQMLRIATGPYENKRSSLLLKRKEYEDKEFEVLAIEEGVGNRSGQAGRVCVREKITNIEFAAGIKAAEPMRLELLRNADKYVGGEVTIRYNGRTPAGVPRFPRAIAWYPGGRDL